MASRTPPEFSTIDFDRSAQNLSSWLRERRQSEWSPTERVNRLRDLATRLDKLADELWETDLWEVEHAVDADPPPRIGLDGRPIPQPPEESRFGTYETCQSGMHEIARFARQLAEGYPAPQARPYLQEAATAFLHLWLEDGRDRPTMYDNGEAVTTFANILESGGHPMTTSRARGILGKAWSAWDRYLICPLFDEIVVWRQ